MRAIASCTVVLVLTVRGVMAIEPLPISAELKPPVVTPRTTVDLRLLNSSTRLQEYQVASIVHARPLGVVDGRKPEVYWAPLDLATGRSYLANSAPWLKLKPGEHVSVSFELATLRWGLLRSSVWPEQGLGSVLPAGNYDVWYELDAVLLSSDRHIASRPVRLTVP
jgi:hypothetical protein